MDDKKKNRKSLVTARLRWLFGFLLLLICYWWVMANFVIGDFWDPQYARKAERLRARLAEQPGRPLWAIMGSSHVDNGLRLGELPEGIRNGSGPLLFNFGMGGADIFRQMICLRRLVKDGMKPERVWIEVNASLSTKESYFLITPLMIARARRNELSEYCDYSTSPAWIVERWLQSRINPICQYGIGGQTLAWRLVPAGGMRLFENNPLDEWGWNPGSAARRGPAYYHNAIRGMFQLNPENYLSFQISQQSDRCLRQIIEFCKKEGIGLFLLRMPQSVDYQALFSAQARANLDVYLDQITGEYGLQMIDARSWIKPEGFTDGRHLNGEGATEFTRRFAGVLLGGETGKVNSNQ